LTLAAAAAVTERVRIGSSVLVEADNGTWTAQLEFIAEARGLLR
jgi:hypothetical protein